eukprot:5241951-Pleurochrysis_carterae.AAC.1
MYASLSAPLHMFSYYIASFCTYPCAIGSVAQTGGNPNELRGDGRAPFMQQHGANENGIGGGGMGGGGMGGGMGGNGNGGIGGNGGKPRITQPLEVRGCSAALHGPPDSRVLPRLASARSRDASLRQFAWPGPAVGLSVDAGRVGVWRLMWQGRWQRWRLAAGMLVGGGREVEDCLGFCSGGMLRQPTPRRARSVARVV